MTKPDWVKPLEEFITSGNDKGSLLWTTALVMDHLHSFTWLVVWNIFYFPQYMG
jgi:hypothetical protein